MKKLASVVAALLLCGLLGAMFISQPQGLVSAALGELKLESIPPQGGIVGAPPQFKVSKATLEFLHKVEKDQKVIEVEPDGSLQIK